MSPKTALLSDIEESIYTIFPFLASELTEFLTVVSCVLAEFEGGVSIFECNNWSSKQDPIFLKFAYIDLDMGRGRLGLDRPAVFEGPQIKLRVKHFWG